MRKTAMEKRSFAYLPLKQARRQESVTGGAEINFEGAREDKKFMYVNSRGAREIYSSVDQTYKVKNKKKVFSSKISTNSG